MRAPNDDKTKKTQGPTKQRSMCLVVQSEVLMREMFNCSHLKSQRDVFGSPSNGRSGRASAMLATSALRCLIRLLCFLLKKNKHNFVYGCQIVAQLRWLIRDDRMSENYAAPILTDVNSTGAIFQRQIKTGSNTFHEKLDFLISIFTLSF